MPNNVSMWRIQRQEAFVLALRHLKHVHDFLLKTVYQEACEDGLSHFQNTLEQQNPVTAQNITYIIETTHTKTNLYNFLQLHTYGI